MLSEFTYSTTVIVDLKSDPYINDKTEVILRGTVCCKTYFDIGVKEASIFYKCFYICFQCLQSFMGRCNILRNGPYEKLIRFSFIKVKIITHK